MSEPSWLSIGIVREVIRRLNQRRRALLAESRSAWWRTLAVGIAATCAFDVLLVLIADRLRVAGAVVASLRTAESTPVQDRG